MMSLHDQIQDDLSMILNLDEMASEHTIGIGVEKKTITVILDNDSANLDMLKSQGVYPADCLFYAKSSDVAGVTANMLIQFDGNPYQVVGIVEDDGLTRVSLQAAKGGF